jgi:hypothetical protein
VQQVSDQGPSALAWASTYAMAADGNDRDGQPDQEAAMDTTEDKPSEEPVSTE